MMTPRESFQEIARLLTSAADALKDMPASDPHIGVLGLIVGAHTHAALQAASLIKRERAGALAAMPCITETRQ